MVTGSGITRQLPVPGRRWVLDIARGGGDMAGPPARLCDMSCETADAALDLVVRDHEDLSNPFQAAIIDCGDGCAEACNMLSLRVARRLLDGDLAFEAADAVMNWVGSYMVDVRKRLGTRLCLTLRTRSMMQLILASTATAVMTQTSIRWRVHDSRTLPDPRRLRLQDVENKSYTGRHPDLVIHADHQTQSENEQTAQQRRAAPSGTERHRAAPSGTSRLGPYSAATVAGWGHRRRRLVGSGSEHTTNGSTRSSTSPASR